MAEAFLGEVFYCCLKAFGVEELLMMFLRSFLQEFRVVIEPPFEAGNVC